MTKDNGASVPDQALAVPVEPASGLAPSGFDPSRDEIDQLIENIQALYDAATPGEWIWYQNGWAPHWTGSAMEFVPSEATFNGVGAGDMDGGDWAVTAFQGDGQNGENNARFIACAKNWMPALIECARTVRELKRRIEPASGMQLREDGLPAEAEGLQPDPQGDAK